MRAELLNIVERVIALRALTRESGLSTKRSQSSLLIKLGDAELTEVAKHIRDLETADGGDRHAQATAQ
jgi:hypothetical protein